MPQNFRFLLAESEPREARDERRESAGRSSGESYAETLRQMEPGVAIDLVKPVEEAVPEDLGRYDAVFLCGSPMHVYEDTPEVRRMLDFVRGVFAQGVPSFGSCAGLQLAVAAAGGTVRPRRDGQEAGFARRITATDAGRGHPLLGGRSAAWDAIAIHGDEVEELPPGAVLLAQSAGTVVQAVEIRQGEGVFWGVQYHPELSLEEVAPALHRQSETLLKDGLARDEAALEAFARRVDALAQAPDRRDLAWQLGLDDQVTDTPRRRLELRNFMDRLAAARRDAR